jgi:DNA-binding transcriptional ArsR family regulator
MAYEKALHALADPTRRAVFEHLRKRPSSVGEIADRFPVSRPAVSQHLRVLKQAGLVAERREGTRRIYAVEVRGLAELRRYIDRMWNDALTAFGDEAEKQGGKR